MKPAQTIYLVDDDSLMIKLYSSVLETYGYLVKSFQDPREGLESTIKNPPDLLLLDLKMPFLDGFTFLYQLRSKLPSQDLPVIVLTNLSGEDEANLAQKQGIADYIVKSDTSPEELVKRIKKALS